ncbi:WcaF family extracellular polysaccharide biosynthesis acetyltransferase [Marinilongibacter aquaticus]|uniref:WcaF family extracellular polysaccharide biosynthesis acetyltransferase n=1 Tax=Marinilongibacter aquaticus TaxID=2975157 RepID=UPI0021BDCE86|nr:WcaF family extracellular polysaccharide biosynthesis acetyltransferase [Marinilongibacter aquaticus]UBM59443.1 WcaF family extracellular polysaccharide biosynthesis acetyltransferase [Marinilongibacter aquaticus]
MKKVDLTKFDNSWYKPGSLLKRVSWFVFGRMFINTYMPLPMKLKIFVLRSFGAKVGNGLVIKPKVNIKYPWFLEIGQQVWIGEKVWIDNFCMVRIGDNACISQDALLLTGNHNYKRETFDLIIDEIVLEEGAWIGAKSLVTQGVTAGAHSVLAAGSVLSKSMGANEIWRGNPASFVRNRIITE